MDDKNRTKITDLFADSTNAANTSFDNTQNVGTNISQIPKKSPSGAETTEFLAAGAGGSNQQGNQTSDYRSTSDFKSNLTSQLSMDVSAFSDYFKSGLNDPKKRIMLMVVVTALICGGLFLYMNKFGSSSSSDYEEDEFSQSDFDDDDSRDSFDNDDDNDITEDSNQASSSSDSDDGFDAEDTASFDYEEELAEEDQEIEDEFAQESMDSSDAMSGLASATGGEGAPRIISPSDDQSRNYDETSEYAQFEWEGEPGGVISFSRSSNMIPLEKQIAVSENYYRLAHPWPGTWFWRVENNQGSSAVKRFYVDPPIKRQMALDPLLQPLSGSGGVVSWQGDTKVARYVIEISQSGWSNPQFKFQTSGTSLTLNSVTPGSYQLRLGAFSEVSGRWEYTDAISANIE